MSKRQEGAETSSFASTGPPDSPFDIDSIPDAVVVADIDSGRIIQANTAAGELFGCDSNSLIDLHQSELHPSEAAAEYMAAFERSIEAGRTNRLRDGTPLYIERPDGERIPVEINVRQLDGDSGPIALGVFRDATDQIDRQSALEETSSRLTTLLDALPVPVAVLDTNGDVRRWNQAAEETFGFEANAVVGEPYPLFVDDADFGETLTRILDGEIVDGYETTHRARDGKRIKVELFARPLYETGEVTGVIGAAVDISDRTHRIQQLDVLHRVLRHNLRNELTVIQGRANQLEQENKTGTVDTTEAVTQISDASDRLAALSEQANQLQTELQPSDAVGPAVTLEAFLSGVTEAAPGDVSVDNQLETGAPEELTVPGAALPAIRDLIEEVRTYRSGEPFKVSVAIQDHDISIDVAADGELLPLGSQMLLTEGAETDLQHGSDLAVAKPYFMVQNVGGELSYYDGNEECTLRIEFPRMQSPDHTE